MGKLSGDELKQYVHNLQAENSRLKEEISDLTIMYENTVEHGTLIENELEEKNSEINNLITAMKIYLSPQLFDSILYNRKEVTLAYKRKKLTIFFSDIVDFTQLTDMMEPEILSDLLNQYLDEMSQIAIQYGGTIDKFIGDAIMIFFGDPEFIDDETHAVHCVRMAIDMMKKTKELSSFWLEKGAPQGLTVRMGINTGFCTVGNFGSKERMDYTAIGGQVNIASRLEKIADRGTIFISGNTYPLVRDIVDVEEPSTVQVKGIHFPVPVLKIIGLKEDSGSCLPEYCESSESEFRLKPIVYNSETPASKKEDMVKSLEYALNFLKST